MTNRNCSRCFWCVSTIHESKSGLPMGMSIHCAYSMALMKKGARHNRDVEPDHVCNNFITLKDHAWRVE